jgi:hypothetical protein
MQNDIGSKIFPAIIEIKDKHAETFTDTLNALEKLGYLDDATRSAKMR